MAFVTFEDVGKVYKSGDVAVRALHNVSFEIEKGEICVVVGQSGAGKTTLLNILGGMDTLTEGHVLLDGRDISTLNEKQMATYRRFDIGFVFQFYNLIPNLTAVENVEIASQLSKDPLDSMAVMKQVGLADRALNFPAQLSGGQPQRVGIARALVMEPDVLLFDEPTSALDPELVGEVLACIRKVAQTGITMMIVTHEIAFAKEAATRVIFMEGGVVVEDGSPQEVIDHPKTTRTQEFLARING